MKKGDDRRLSSSGHPQLTTRDSGPGTVSVGQSTRSLNSWKGVLPEAGQIVATHSLLLREINYIDEAHLLRLELLAQLHALTQLPFDQKTMVPMVLSGQNILIDRLLFHTSRPFAS